jgi:hypothetical protein
VTVIRSIEQAKLGEWLSVGRGMLLRYQNLLAGGAAPAEEALGAIIAARTPLLDRIEDADRTRGDLPPDGDREVNELRALIDGVIGKLFGDDTLQQRLLHTEQHWGELLDSGIGLDWNADELQLLRELQADNRKAIAALATMPN